MTYSRLDYESREVIRCELDHDRGVPFAVIARRVGCHRSTVQREVARNGGRLRYSAFKAQERAFQQQQRRCRFEREPDLASEVHDELVAGYSPWTIAQGLPVSAETIYQGVYSGVLDVDPQEVLRTRPKSKKRRHRHLRQPTSDGNYLGDFTPISKRPEDIEKRNSFGHWEGDLITGSKNQSAVVSLTERRSRFQYLIELPDGHGTQAVITAISQWIESHDRVIESLTWDRGAELTNWTDLKDNHGIDIYFCDPRSPWQRGSNENQNRQSRFWLRKGTDLAVHSQNDLNQISYILNTTARRIHNGATAHHIYQQHPRTRE